MIEALALLGLLGVGGLALAFAARNQRDQRAAFAADCSEAARAIGGEYLDDFHGSMLSPGRNRIGVTVDDLRVTIELMVEGKNVEKTVFSAQVPYHEPLRISLSPHDALDGLFTAFGEQDILVGDADFDRAFRVRGDKPAMIRAFLSARVRQHLLDAREVRCVTLDAGSAKLEASTRSLDEDRLKAGAAAVAALAGAGLALERSWQSTAAALGGRRGEHARSFDAPCAGGSAHVELADDGASITVQVPGLLVAEDRLLVAPAGTEHQLGALGAVTLEHLSGSPWRVLAADAVRAEKLLDARTCNELLALGGNIFVLLRDKNGVTLRLPGGEPDLERVQRALALCAHLAQPIAAGPYR